MKKLIIRDGLVGPLKEDLQGVQGYVLSNIKDSMKLFIKSTGLRIEETSGTTKNFRLQAQVYSDKVLFICENLGPVVFRDYEFCVPEQDTKLKALIDINELYRHEQYYIWLHKVESGSFSKNIDLEIIASASNASPSQNDYILMYEVQLNQAEEIEITKDYRNENSLKLRPDGDNLAPNAPESVTAQTIYQNQLLLDQYTIGGDTNTLSPHTNLSVSNCYLKIEWTPPESNMYAYEVKVSPMSPGTSAPAHDRAFKKIVIAESNNPSAIFRVCDGVKYSIAVRCIDGSANKNYGEWSGPMTIVAGADILENIPAPPEMTIVEYNNPTILFIDLSVSIPPPGPYYVQLFRTNAQGANSGLRQLIYEGDPGTIPVVLEENAQNVIFSARLVGPGGICSEFVVDNKSYGGTKYDVAYNASQPAEDSISVPLYINEQTASPPADIYLSGGVNFILPPPGGRIKRILFHSRGSVLIGGNPPLCDSLELLIGQSPESAISIDIQDIPNREVLLANRDHYLNDFDSGTFGLTEKPYWQSESSLFCWVKATNLSEQTTLRVYGTVILYYDRRNINEV